MPRCSVGAAGATGSNDNQTWLRKSAIKALALAKDDFKRRGMEPKPKALARVAAGIFNGKCPGHTIGRPARFIALWAKRWAATTSLADAKRRGRRSKPAAEAAARAVQLLEAGFKDGEVLQRSFLDIRHALLECKELERIRRKAHLNAESFWRRLSEEWNPYTHSTDHGTIRMHWPTSCPILAW
jgi:DNA-binding phage protein